MKHLSLALGAEYLSARGVPLPELESQLLLADCLGIGRERLLSMRPDTLPAEAAEAFRRALRLRAGGTPLAYILRNREFWSLDFAVDGRVLVPRPDTELLVAAALNILSPGCTVADVGTGSGNIVISLAREVKEGSWYATDISPGALQVAASNLRRHGMEGRVHLLCCDLLGGVRHAGDFDAVISNPPYIPREEIAVLQPEVRLHEPRIALDGGIDGLESIRRLIATAPEFLRAGGWLLLEVGDRQSPAVREIFKRDGRYRKVTVERDLAGVERVVAAQRSPWTA